jgi:Alpha-lytic protease prodomain
VDSHRGYFAGVELRTDRREVVVRVPSTHGSSPARRLLGTLPATAQRDAGAPGQSGRRATHRAGAADRSRWTVRFVSARFSLAELEAVRAEMNRREPWASIVRPVLTEWYVDVARNRVVIGVATITPALREAARRAFGERAELSVVAAPAVPFSRTDDWAPWVGGSLIRTPATGSSCSSGYVLRNIFSGQRALVTAGHCGRLNDTVTNNGDPIGTIIHRTRTENGYDFAMIGGQTYEAWLYQGPPGSDFGDWVRGGYDVVVGDEVCLDGASSGELCNARVDALDLCRRFTDGVTICHLNRVQSTDGWSIGARGDSGGPVFRYDAAGQKVAGSIVGGTDEATTAYFHDILVPGWPSVGWNLDQV